MNPQSRVTKKQVNRTRNDLNLDLYYSSETKNEKEDEVMTWHPESGEHGID